ncbi:CheC, inhibitor of MCP methylation [Hymenobacter roseosalivarius DSM 11622]|uniref:CheC, inhibitor of MCP methylation n=1 Tax=Hymenobacter roseosalivarius DSM 11622 TaxID=645990 RepID=A0A1W1W5K0_9BACT|nr:chemotaxis protein CheC [Hymenobacter roseosalivarius]SMC00384.1 CheC, inhibitor of MCP methylation [Hymenobacter roseosalivarius DSM 11622]
MYLHMTELERDIIREILNIGLARAADSFASIAQETVLLEVPSLDLVPGTSILERVKVYEKDHVVIQSDIKGEFNGSTLMFFSGQHVQRLSRVCLRLSKPESVEIDELQESLLLEISNIITGALVTQLANILKANIYGAPPIAPKGHLDTSLTRLVAQNPLYQPMVFSVITHFSDKKYSVELPLMLFFDRETFVKILEIIRTYDFLNGQQATH